MKNLFKNTRQEFIKWIKEKRFYIMLFCSIMIIGSAYVFVSWQQSAKAPTAIITEDISHTTPPIHTTAPAPASTFIPELTNVSGAIAPQHPKATTKPKQIPNQLKTEAATQAVASQAQAPPEATPPPPPKKLIYPVSGTIIKEFSVDNLVYSKTLGDWRTHEGIDIKAEIGTMVKAGGDGIVEDVYIDEEMGITVIIDHQNGMKSVYSNLSTDSMVHKGQEVKQGEVISGVGDTALYETGEVGHLHFEVLIDGEKVNPKDYLTA